MAASIAISTPDLVRTRREGGRCPGCRPAATRERSGPRGWLAVPRPAVPFVCIEAVVQRNQSPEGREGAVRVRFSGYNGRPKALEDQDPSVLVQNGKQ